MQYRGFELDPFQETSITALSEGRSVLVSAPTGTGKTLIADFVVERALARGRSVIYTAPVKALSNQKYRDWCRLHGEDKVGLITGDLVIRRDAPCRVMTTEILRNMLLTGEVLPELEAVIIDEIHFLDDRERGTTWEEVLIYLPHRVQILGLSATLQNLSAFSGWLGSVRGAEVEVVQADRRTVPLSYQVFSHREGLLSPKEFHKAWARHANKPAASKGPPRRGGRRDRDSNREAPTSHVELIQKLDEEQYLPCLYFSFSRKNTERFARELGEYWRRHSRQPLLNRFEQRELEHHLDSFASSESGNAMDRELRDLYREGIAFHHAGLHVQLKALVEDLYEKRLIKVLYCTSTFALGINMPARTVVFDGLKKYDGIRLRPLNNREFQQKAGRAGRRGLDTEGHVVIRVDSEYWPDNRELLDGYLKGAPEPVRSSFSLCFNSVVNLLARNPENHIREIVEKSFLCWTRIQEAERLEERAGERNAGKFLAKAEKIRERSWDEFEQRVTFLKQVGYLAEDRSFNAGGRILQHVQIEEVFVTELVLSGLLEDIPMPLLFGLCCSLNKEFPRDVRIRYKMRGAELDLAREANRIRYGSGVQQAEELTRMPVTWCPDMIPFGKMWAEGKSLAELESWLIASTDLTGDLVGAFRRAKDLITQLRLVWKGDRRRCDELTELLASVSRDEVLVVD